jgi:hypothetical protein
MAATEWKSVVTIANLTLATVGGALYLAEGMGE